MTTARPGEPPNDPPAGAESRQPVADRQDLERALRELVGLADEGARPQVTALQARLTAGEVRVLLVGEAKRGKSTLGNALIGRDLLPTGVRPVTAITTTVESGGPEQLVVTFLDGRREQHRVGDLAEFVTESRNPRNTRSVADVRVVVENSWLSPAVLVDTPGVGSVFAHNTDEATQAMESMDLAVFVLTADPPISLTERRLLESVRERAVATFVALNKVDRLSSTELGEAAAFAAEVTGIDRVFPCAARNAVAARLAQDPEGFAASGVGSLSDAVAERIAAGAERDLVASVASGAARVADAALERVRLTRAAVTAVIENRGRDVELFSEEVGRSEQMLTEALASISWETREVRRRLDTAAGEHSRRTRLELLARLDGLSATIADEPAVRRARQMVVTVIEHDVEAWRGDQLAGFDQGMSTLVSRQQERLDRVADGVRDAAQRLLGLELRPVIEQLSVPDVGGFRFDFTPAVGWNTAVVEGVRRHLPGRWRRSAVAAHLRTETLTLVDRQYGRARADLQVRLEAAHQQLARELTSRVTEQRDALTAALAAATDLQAGTSEQQQRHVDALAARIDALQRLGLRMRQQSGETPAVEPAPQDEARDTQDDSGRPQGRA